jgi:dsRNA-specific ribonuclease
MVVLSFILETCLSVDKAAKVLALIGDAAISLALIQILWQPNISNVGELSTRRSEYASNENLAKVYIEAGLDQVINRYLKVE